MPLAPLGNLWNQSVLQEELEVGNVKHYEYNCNIIN